MRDEDGQASVEYVLVLLAFMAALLALGAVWGLARSGWFQRAQREAASHSFSVEDPLGGVRDIVLY